MSSATIARQSDWMNIKTNLLWIYDGPVSSAGRSGRFNTGFLSGWLMRKDEVTLQMEGKQVKASAGERLRPGRETAT